VTVFLVRHGQALSRHEWGQPDDIRPLSKRGDRQARELVTLLADAPIARVLSSPATRCRLTVEPLAEDRGLDVELADELLEGAAIDRSLRLLRKVTAEPGDVVLCSHGDVIPEVLRHLGADGLKLRSELKWAKGSTWKLTWDGRRFTDAHYLPPPA
jgi:8-oxo-dGTP diphosphatase